MQVITIVTFLGFLAASSATSFYVEPDCPKSGNEHEENIVIPNPDDCRSFYRCDHGVPRLEFCSDGLHFDPELMTCNFPEQAGCDKSLTSTKKPATTSTRKPGTKPPSHPKFCDQREVECPPQSSVHDDVKLANPDDCGSFCHCSYGLPWWTPCPPGLHFDDDTKLCDYPNGKCRIN